MTPESQRIAIAEACGWKNMRIGTFASLYGCSPNPGHGRTIVPDYLNDLNAMHEAEKVLNAQQRVVYWDLLQEITEYSWYATAPQRATQFLRTLGLWKE